MLRLCVEQGMIQLLEPVAVSDVLNFVKLDVALRSEVVLLLEMPSVSVQFVSILHTLELIVLVLHRLSIVVVHLRPETVRDDFLDGRHLRKAAVVIYRRAQVWLILLVHALMQRRGKLLQCRL